MLFTILTVPLFPILYSQLVDVDVIAGLDMMVQRKQWDKAIETAEQQVSSVAQGYRESVI